MSFKRVIIGGVNYALTQAAADKRAEQAADERAEQAELQQETIAELKTQNAAMRKKMDEQSNIFAEQVELQRTQIQQQELERKETEMKVEQLAAFRKSLVMAHKFLTQSQSLVLPPK